VAKQLGMYVTNTTTTATDCILFLFVRLVFDLAL
jgi:hypothetical protein